MGVYAGLLGMVHGYFALQQENNKPDGLMFNAIGPPCVPDEIYHACFPAMTLMPNLQTAGFLALGVGLTMAIWAAFFVQKRHGGLILILCAIALLFVGGGFIPMFTGIAAGLASTQINSTFHWWHNPLSSNIGQLLAKLWPWALVVYFLFILSQLLLGNMANAFLLQAGAILLFVELLLILFSILSAFSYDMQRIRKEEQ